MNPPQALGALALLVPLTLLGQAPAIHSVDPQPSPGSRTTMWVSGVGAKATVMVGGRPAAVLGYTNEANLGESLDIQIPVELMPGPASIELIFEGVSAKPFPVTLDRYAPRIFGAPSDCSPGRTLKPGDRGVLYAVGLGPTDAVVPTGVPAPGSPLARTLALPRVLVEGEPVEVFESVLAPGEVGLYRVAFKVPAGDGFRRFAVGIDSRDSPSSSFPVGNVIVHGSASTLPAPSRDGPAAPDSILSAYPCGAPFSDNVEFFAEDPRNGATTLGGLTMTVKDSRGVQRPAPLLYASNRVDYIVPSGTSEGLATVSLSRSDGRTSTGILYIQALTPRLLRGFASAPAAIVTRVREGVSRVEQVIETTPPFWVPIDLGPATDEVFLVLFGTGVRHRRSLEDLKVVFLNNSNSPNFRLVQGVIEHAGAQGEFAGVDQVNVRLPRTLAGSGFNKVLLVTAEQMSKWPIEGPTGPENEGRLLFFK